MSPTTRKLPAQPNLEQLKKQAKELLEQYRAGEPHAVNEVKQFAWDSGVAAFALHDAQRVLARAYGFASWPKLKAFVDGANVRCLADAVKAGDLAQVRALLSARPKLIGMDMSGGDERQALHFAVVRRDVPMVKLLMEAGADARKGVYPHRSATTALVLAQERGYDDIVAVIEEEERHRREEMSCPNATVSPVQDQITEAIHNGETAAAMILLNEDKSLIQACDRNGATPLHIAAQCGDIQLLEWLLAHRARIDKEDIHGFTPLDHAALAPHPQNDAAQHFPAVAQRLLQAGATLTIWGALALGDVDTVKAHVLKDRSLLRKQTKRGGLLSIAVNHNQLDMVRALLSMGADVDERILLQDLEEPTLSWGQPLWNASLAGQKDIAQVLLDAGADPNANVYASGWPIRNAWHHDDPAIKELLLARGAKVPPFMVAELHDVERARELLHGTPDESTVTALLEAAGDTGCPEIVAMCLPHINWKPNDERWRWYLSQPMRGIGNDGRDHEGHFRSMELLLSHNMDVNAASFGQTCLHFVAGWHGELSEEDRARFTEMLLQHGARVDLRDEILQSTPLAWACRWGREQMANLLLRHGAPVEEPDAEPWATPIAWAQKAGHTNIVSLLLTYRNR